jgi:hypothetical protein
VPGDARLELARAADGSYDVLALDAFSSDFIPTHLLTQEAARLYQHKLRPGGVLVYHISSRFLDFAPMVAKLAEGLGMVCLSRLDCIEDPAEVEAGRMPSRYQVMAEPGVLPDCVTQRSDWSPVTPPADMPPWRDDYCNLWSVLRR